MTVYRNRTRLGMEELEDRCTPSTMLGNFPSDADAAAGGAPAHVGAARQQAVPFQLSAHITSDGSGILNLSGGGSHLGRWTGQGAIDNIDVDTDGVVISATATITAANGDRLFVSVSVTIHLATGQAEETLTFTGGTGRFAGVTGTMSPTCEATWDPASPLTFECDGAGSGTLVFAR